MPQIKIYKNLKAQNNIILLIVVVVSCTLLIFINYFTIKILSANRAYVNGESNYSKGQKDAVRHLTTYLYTNENKHWELYKKEINVPKGDGIARRALLNNDNIEEVKKGFRAGRNNEKDLDDLIWIFKNFKFISFIKIAIKEWEHGDSLIDKIDVIANNIDSNIKSKTITNDTKLKFLNEIDNLSNQLTISEKNFSNSFGEGTRQIKEYLIYTNIFFILIIIGSVGIYYSKMIKKILSSNIEIEYKNRNLVLLNNELDKFVYSASHDLRSPITSLKGLIEISKLENNPNQVNEYLNLMLDVLNKQDQFISDIIDYSKNKKKEAVSERVDIIQIINDALNQHFLTKEKFDQIIVKKEIIVKELISDPLRLKIIINNIISNAIKYSDKTKDKTIITIKSYLLNESCIIEIKDNGIGINEENITKIFDMFFVTNHNKGSGLGLYIVKEAIEIINGTISVESKTNIGTTFKIAIPYRYE